jgi:hypothetical protein
MSPDKRRWSLRAKDWLDELESGRSYVLFADDERNLRANIMVLKGRNGAKVELVTPNGLMELEWRPFRHETDPQKERPRLQIGDLDSTTWIRQGIFTYVQDGYSFEIDIPRNYLLANQPGRRPVVISPGYKI